ncbi:MAG: lysophospholipid acyltransferase family protein [Saprospiraceae bacterium]
MKNTTKYLPFYLLASIPRPILHRLLNLLFILLYPIIFYRKKVVLDNLRKAFPTHTLKKIKEIQKAFYRQFLKNFEDLIPLLIQSKKAVYKSVEIKNMELLNELMLLNKPIIIVTAHYGSWEKAFSALPIFINKPVGLVYTPVKSNYFSALLLHIRTRFGLNLITRYTFKEHIGAHLNQTYFYIMPSDQRPVDPKKSFWTPFLGIETPLLFGVEKHAVQYHLPAIYLHVKDMGHQCHINFSLICKSGKETEYGFITKKYAELLEKQIVDDPTQWLWSHRRWKEIV